MIQKKKNLVFSLSLLISLFIFLNIYLEKDTPLPKSLAFSESLKTKKLELKEVQTLKGKFNLSEKLKGKKFIVHFWASWCAPCYTEFPHLLSYLRKNKVHLIAISMDDSLNEMEDFMKKINWKKKDPIYWVWDEDEKYFEQFFISSLPTSFIFDENHLLVQKIIGDHHWKD